MAEKKVTPNVTLFDRDYDSFILARANMDVFLNGKYLNEVRNDRTLLDSIGRAANAEFGAVYAAINKVLNPELFTPGHVPQDEIPTIESDEEYAKRMWPKNKEARRAFLLGCKFPTKLSKEWDIAYKKIHKEYALREGEFWAEQQEADIEMLKSLSAEERQKIFVQRVTDLARRFQDDANRGPDY